MLYRYRLELGSYSWLAPTTSGIRSSSSRVSRPRPRTSPPPPRGLRALWFHLRNRFYTCPWPKVIASCMMIGRRLYTIQDALTPGGGGGGTRLSFGRGGAAGGSKTWPCLKPLGAQEIHPVPIYLTKTFICIVTLYWYGRTLYSAEYHHTFINICCVPRALLPDRGPVINTVVPHAPSLVPRSRACYITLWAGNPAGKPGSNPVINGIARQ